MAGSIDQGQRSWRGRPIQGVLLRVAVYAVPWCASVLAGLGLSRVLPPPAGAGQAALRWALIALVSFLALWLVDRLARRLLPLATLLRLTMSFPQAAPSRYRVARTSTSVKELERRVALVRESGVPTEPGEAAATILSLLTALSLHDRRTRGHSERVRIFTDLIAEQLYLDSDARDKLRWAALVHDMGKLMVPDGILNKAGKPTELEWEVLRRHPELGARLCAPLMPWLGEWGLAIVQHHERFDGTGYPARLGGQDISLAARILSVADSFEVMTSARSYKRAMSALAAREEAVEHAGSQFDPLVVRALLQISLPRLRLAMGPLSWLTQIPFLWRVPALSGQAGAAAATMGGVAVIGLGSAASGMSAVALADQSPPAVTADQGGEPPSSIPSQKLAPDYVRATSGGRDGTISLDVHSPGDAPLPADQLVAADVGQPIVAPETVSSADSPEPTPSREARTGEAAGGRPGRTTTKEPPGDSAGGSDGAAGRGNEVVDARPEAQADGVPDDPTAVDDLVGVVESVVDPVGDLVDDVVDPVEDIIDDVVDPVEDIIDDLTDPIDDVADPIDDVIDPIDDVIDPIDDVVDPIEDLIDPIWPLP